MKRDLFDLSQKVIVVTGGGGLLGKGIVEMLAEKGAIVCSLDIVKTDFSSKNIHSILKDMTNMDLIDENLQALWQEFGKIDVWVNAAFPKTKDWSNHLPELKVESWRKNVDLHMNSYCWISNVVAGKMKREEISGSIINFSSIYGMLGPDFDVYQGTDMTMPAAYAAIKSGILNYSRYLANYFGDSGIRVNTISPGGVLNHQDEKFVKQYIQKTPLKRMGRIEDIAAGVVYLSSDASQYVTGHNLVIDGGWSSH